MSRSDKHAGAKRAARALLRYPWAATLIPLGLAFGVGGMVQHAVRTVRRRGR